MASGSYGFAVGGYDTAGGTYSGTLNYSIGTESITANSSTVTLPAISLSGRLNRSNGGWGSSGSAAVSLPSGICYYQNGTQVTKMASSAMMSGGWCNTDYSTTVNSKSVNTSSIFKSSNNTQREVTLELFAPIIMGSGYSTAPVTYNVSGRVDNVSLPFSSGTLKVTLNAPPTFNASQVYADTGLTIGTVAKVDVSSLSAKYGGTISEVLLTIGEQTATTTTAGTMSITLDTVGVFTPTVKVTDSRGQETTKTLNTIIVRSELPTWVEPVTDRANSKTRTTATDMTRIASDCAYLGGQNEITEYSLGDFVAESEWSKIISFAQTLDATITSSTDYLNLNKIEIAFKNAHDDL